jgi:hypothetical protein
VSPAPYLDWHEQAQEPRDGRDAHIAADVASEHDGPPSDVFSMPEPATLPRVPAPRAATLSKLKRQFDVLRWERDHLSNVIAWSRDDLERAEFARENILLTWQLVDLQEEIRQREYHWGDPSEIALRAPPEGISSDMATQSTAMF